MFDYPNPRPSGNRPYVENEADVSFQEFMAPDVDWIDEPDYVRVFRELTGEAPMAHEAAYTAPTGAGYPPFINIATADVDIVQVTVRSAAEDGKVGALARIHLHVDDWRQLLADAARLTFPGKGTDTAGESTLDQRFVAGSADAAGVPQACEYDGKAYPTERDPLMQRTDPALPDDHPDNDGYWIRIADEKHDNQMADLDADADRGGGASAGDPLGQRASADLSGNHTNPTETRYEPGDDIAGDYDHVNQRFTR